MNVLPFRQGCHCFGEVRTQFCKSRFFSENSKSSKKDNFAVFIGWKKIGSSREAGVARQKRQQKGRFLLFCCFYSRLYSLLKNKLFCLGFRKTAKFNKFQFLLKKVKNRLFCSLAPS